MDLAELRRVINQVPVFYRVSPRHKVTIVKVWSSKYLLAMRVCIQEHNYKNKKIDSDCAFNITYLPVIIHIEQLPSSATKPP